MTNEIKKLTDEEMGFVKEEDRVIEWVNFEEKYPGAFSGKPRERKLSDRFLYDLRFISESIVRNFRYPNYNVMFKISVGSFLDEFNIVSEKVKVRMLAASPVDIRPPENMAFLGAMAHKLANDNGLVVPSWVFEKRFYLDMPYYAWSSTQKIIKILYKESPQEFRERNLYVSADVFSRC